MASYTIGIDTGGTFTDGVLLNEHGEAWTFKAPTTPRNFHEGVIACLDGLAATQDRPIEALLGDTALLVHGTTIATNMMVTLNGAKVGLLTTKGHRDALHMSQGRFGTIAGLPREALNTPGQIDKPPALVPKQLIREVTERIDSRGEVVVTLDEDEVRTAVLELLDVGVEAFAVSLLWSFRNPAHEHRVGEIIAELAPTAFTSLSSSLVPRLGEFIRTSSTVINSFCGPTFSTYMRTLGGELAQRGLAKPPLIMSSTGGCVPLEVAGAQPLLALQSGPAGGIAGALRVGAELGDDNVICTDMGGTSFDVGLVSQGRAVVTDEGVAGRYPYALSLVDIESIGSGGGSIASVDARGTVRVGPQSAGAEPGPACYGRGGQLPTVTDADLVLGYISPDAFLGGRMRLDLNAARRAIETHVADPLGISVEAAAFGIYTIVNAQMADFIRMKTIRAGHDPREFAIFAFGGAGPVHASMYSRDLGAKAFVVPLGNTSSVFSAYGLTATDVERVWEMSFPMQQPFAWDRFAAIFDGLGHDARAALEADGFAGDTIELQRSVTMKYAGQIHSLQVDVQDDVMRERSFELLQDHFDVVYDRIFGTGAGYREAGSEIMSFKVKGVARVERTTIAAEASGGDAAAMATRSRDVYWGSAGGYVDTPVLAGTDLRPGAPVAGPMIIELPDTSVPVPPEDIVELTDGGTLIIRMKEGA
jgi:N-methylhydantoinase A